MATAGNIDVPAKCVVWTQCQCDNNVMPRVLVVDDYVDTADAISMVLAADGFSTEIAYRGHTAVELAQRWNPDIVVLDIWMPDMSGLEVATNLRARASTSNAILVGHSAASGIGDLERAKAAGFDAYCAKPTDAATLGPLLSLFCQPAR